MLYLSSREIGADMIEELKMIITMLNGLGSGAYSGFILYIVLNFLELIAILGAIVMCVKGLFKCISNQGVLRRGFIELHKHVEYPKKGDLCYYDGSLVTSEMTKLVAHIISGKE